MNTVTRLSELLDRWQLARQRGEAISAEQLCSDCPELLDEVRTKLAGLASMDQRLTPVLAQPETVTDMPRPESTIDYHESPRPVGPRPDSVPGYEILGVLGHGGMGVVYKARQIKLNRIVALKMIKAGAHAGDSHRQRFLSEAQAIARLQHPHIVQIHEVGEADELPFFSLEFCPGGSLANKLAANPLPPMEAAELVHTLALAIAAAHAQGIIHRDLKPANVLLTDNSTPKIADFGLAKRLEEAGQSVTGDVMGTPSYMAPEQAQGKIKQIGPAADIYALGAILYECLTGRPPFRAATTMDTLWQVIHQEPVSPRQLLPNLPRDLETICLKCLHKEPGKRYANAADLATDLQLWQDGRPIHARPVGPVERLMRWAARNIPAAALIISLILGTAVTSGLAIWAVQERDRADREAGSALKNANNAQISATIAQERELEARANAILANQNEAKATVNEAKAKANAAEVTRQLGRLAVLNGSRFIENGDNLKGLLWYAFPLAGEQAIAPDDLDAHLHRLACHWRFTSRPIYFFHDDRVNHAEFDPTGRRLVTTSRDRTARIWDAASGLPLTATLPHNGDVKYATFNSNGRLLLTDDDFSGVRIWDANTGKQVTQGPSGRSRFGPDGRHVLTGESDKILVWDAITGDVRLSLKAQRNGVGAFNPDGNHVVAGAADRTASVWDIATGKPVTPPLQHKTHVHKAQFSPDGRLIMTIDNQECRLWHAATGKLHIAFSGSVDGTFSPDSKRLVTVGRKQDARIWNVATGESIGAQLSFFGFARAPVFSPDGSRFLLVSNESKSDVHMVQIFEAATGRLLAQPLRHLKSISEASFSPDGRFVVTAGWDGTARIWDAFTGEPLSLFNHDVEIVSRAVFNPDGRRVLTTSGNAARIWNLSAVQTPVLRQAGSISDASFSPDGSRVLLRSFSLKPRSEEVRIWDAATSMPISPPLVHQGSLGKATFSPDGDRVLTTGSGTARIWNAATDVPITPSFPSIGIEAAFSPNGRWLIAGEDKTSLRIWDAQTGHPLANSLAHVGSVAKATFSGDSHRLLTTGSVPKERAYYTQVWDVKLAKPISAPLHHPGLIGPVALSPNGRHVITTSANAKSKAYAAQIWDADAGKATVAPLVHEKPIRTVVFSPDGQRVATLDVEYRARIWRVADGQPLSPLLPHVRSVSIQFSADGRRILATGNTAMVWDAHTGQPLSVPLARNNWRSFSATLSPDGRRILYVAFDESSKITARVWDAVTGLPLTAPLPTDLGGTAGFSPDGATFFTINGRSVQVWNAATGEPITPPLMHSAPVKSAVFSPNIRQLLTTTVDGARLWDVSTDVRPRSDWKLLVELSAGGGLDPYGAFKKSPEESQQMVWKSLMGKSPKDFTVSREAALAWRMSQVGECLREWNLSAAQFHNWHMIIDIVGCQPAADIVPRTAHDPSISHTSLLPKAAPFGALGTSVRAAFTDKQHQQVYSLRMEAGKAYVIEMNSKEVHCEIKLLDEIGSAVARNVNITPGILDARIVFTPKITGNYRVIAAPFQGSARGEFTLTIRESAE